MTLGIGIGHIGILIPSSTASSSCSAYPCDDYVFYTVPALLMTSEKVPYVRCDCAPSSDE